MTSISKRAGDIESLRALLASIPDVRDVNVSTMTEKRRKELRDEIIRAVIRLEDIANLVDPIKHPPHVFDPADPDTIGRLIGETLLAQDRQQLKSLDKFHGSGVYAIYSNCDFPAYALIKSTEVPIYVGKADPVKLQAKSPREQGTKLWGRLCEHAKTIRSASNLKIDDFACRFLVVKSAWQKTAEDYLIARYQPVWNKEVKICDGFGKHGDSPDTRSNKVSGWDTLHPGRDWATRAGNQARTASADEIAQRIEEHLAGFKAAQPKLFQRA